MSFERQFYDASTMRFEEEFAVASVVSNVPNLTCFQQCGDQEWQLLIVAILGHVEHLESAKHR